MPAMRRLGLARIATAIAATLADDIQSCRLLLVRHGETNFNADGRLQGRLESELTAKGHEQAHALGRWIAANEAASVTQSFVSPRRRTRQTLANIEEHAMLPTAAVRPGLREIELTMWEGQHRTALRNAEGEDDRARWEEWKARPSTFVFDEDGHAPLADLAQRAAEEWNALLASTPPASTSLVVARGALEIKRGTALRSTCGAS